MIPEASRQFKNLFKKEDLYKKINRAGNGHCIYISKKVLDLYALTDKSEVRLVLTKEGILIKKITPGDDGDI